MRPSEQRAVRPVRRPIRVAAAVALALLCLSPAAAARPRGCAHADAPVSALARAALRHAAVCLINRQRRAHGLPPLAVSRRLNRSAQRWTRTMVAEHYFGHGTNFGARVTASGFRWSAAGENIATGFPTAAAVVQAWMASAGHCRNILSPDFRYVGTGVLDRAIPGYGSSPGTWTQDFALGLDQRPPSGNQAAAAGCPY